MYLGYVSHFDWCFNTVNSKFYSTTSKRNVIVNRFGGVLNSCSSFQTFRHSHQLSKKQEKRDPYFILWHTNSKVTLSNSGRTFYSVEKKKIAVSRFVHYFSVTKCGGNFYDFPFLIIFESDQNYFQLVFIKSRSLALTD